ncbi:MAG: hypothetical protein EXS09_08745 [Gemmataceae bacterium]|nr:hypothetical protein [Gemmataceae bacterium]
MLRSQAVLWLKKAKRASTHEPPKLRCGPRGDNAVVDSCYRCKLVWLDAGELTVLEQFAATSV